MYDEDPQKLATYTAAKELFYSCYADDIKEHGVEITEVPYLQGHLPVMFCKAEGTCRGRILLHGGNDSYIEEFYDALLYFQSHGFNVYLFEGPGQGGVLRERLLLIRGLQRSLDGPYFRTFSIYFLQTIRSGSGILWTEHFVGDLQESSMDCIRR